eukprot:6986631-Prymnesium_polylepis.1
MSGRGRQRALRVLSTPSAACCLDSAPYRPRKGQNTARPRCSHAIADRAASSPAARPANVL